MLVLLVGLLTYLLFRYQLLFTVPMALIVAVCAMIVVLLVQGRRF